MRDSQRVGCMRESLELGRLMPQFSERGALSQFCRVPQRRGGWGPDWTALGLTRNGLLGKGGEGTGRQEVRRKRPPGRERAAQRPAWTSSLAGRGDPAGVLWPRIRATVRLAAFLSAWRTLLKGLRGALGATQFRRREQIPRCSGNTTAPVGNWGAWQGGGSPPRLA